MNGDGAEASSAPRAAHTASRGWAAELAVLVLFAVLSAAHVAGRWGGVRPFDLLTGDASVYASVAAGRDHPANYARDELLSDPRNTRLATLHVPLLRGLARLTGDYGTAFVALLLPTAVLQLVGFYVLGRVLFGSRGVALLFALATLPRLNLHVGEYWGFHSEAQPRFVFQALWPFFLAAAAASLERPRRWPWILGLAGPLAFLHPVSAPALGASLWLGFAAAPVAWPSRLRSLALGGAAFALTLAPYVVVYLASVQGGGSAPDVDEILRRMAAANGVMTSVPAAVAAFGSALLGAWPLVLAAAAGAVALVRLEPRPERLRMAALWMAGVVLAGIVLPAALQAHAAAAGRQNLDTQLVRNLRLLVPLLMLLVFWSLARVRDRVGGPVPLLVAVVATGGWWAMNPPRELQDGARCWVSGRVFCPTGKYDDVVEAFAAVRRLVPETGALATPLLEGQLRYATLRSVVYSPKDYEALSHTNHDALRAWAVRHEQMTRLRELRPRARLVALVAFGQEHGADHVLADFQVPAHLLAEVPATALWSNGSYTLLRVPK
jgi:hypothetical protein